MLPNRSTAERATGKIFQKSSSATHHPPPLPLSVLSELSLTGILRTQLLNARNCPHEIHGQFHTLLAQLFPVESLLHSPALVPRYLPADMDYDTEKITVRTGVAHLIVGDNEAQDLRGPPSQAHIPSLEPSPPNPNTNRLIQNTKRLDGADDSDDDSDDGWDIKGPGYLPPPRSQSPSKPKSRKRRYIADHHTTRLPANMEKNL